MKKKKWVKESSTSWRLTGIPFAVRIYRMKNGYMVTACREDRLESVSRITCEDHRRADGRRRREVLTTRAKRIARNITEDTEDDYVQALREYYRSGFKNGESGESFLLWLEGKLGLNDIPETDETDE